MHIRQALLGGISAALCAVSGASLASEDVAISGPEILTEIFIPATLEAFARDRGLTIRREITGDGALSMVLGDPKGQQGPARFEMSTSGTSSAIAQLALGEADIAVTTRPPTDDERSVLTAAKSRMLGRDGIIPIVSRDNPVQAVTLDQIRGMIAGEITDWSDLGGAAGAIEIHLLEEGTDQDVILQAILGQELQRGGDLRLHLDHSGIADAVARNPRAVGLSRFSELGNARPLALAGACGLWVGPDRFSIKTGDYPLVMPVILYHRDGDLSPVVAEFLNYLGLDGVQGPIRQAGFVDTLTEELDLTDQGRRLVNAIKIAGRTSPTSVLRRLVEGLEGHSRSSVTFRFEPKSSELDAASHDLVQDFGQALLSGAYEGRKVTLVGFTDGVGTAERNVEVARARARAVERAVRDAAPGLDAEKVELSALGFGEALPIGCDESDWGRRANRRVEVWVD